MIRPHSSASQFVSSWVILGLASPYIPFGSIGDLKGSFGEPEVAPAPTLPISRELTAEELESISGSALGNNPYLSGTQKYSPSYKGVDLLTGNFTMSSTDLSFEGGYGIPIALTRTYNSNNADEGPMGRGWSLSVDIRTTAGGLLKSSGAPIRSVPVTFRERSVADDDPRIDEALEPVEAVLATDAAGLEETIQKDVDGVLTTPPWDKNVMDAEYEMVLFNGDLYQILVANTVLTPEGTVYRYEKKGDYVNGAHPIGNPDGDRYPCNVLKIVSITDRHGNVTTYTYGESASTFVKINGIANEQGLTAIDAPNGYSLEFDWGTVSGRRRIVSATDGTRTVEYTFGGTYSMLTSAESPGGKVTQYDYDGANNSGTLTTPDWWSGSWGQAAGLLTGITDPRGLTTYINYTMSWVFVGPYEEIAVPGVCVWKMIEPNGIYTYFSTWGAAADSGKIAPPLQSEPGGTYPWGCFVERLGESETTDVINEGYCELRFNAGVATVSMFPGPAKGQIQFESAAWVRKYNATSLDLVESHDIAYKRFYSSTIPNVTTFSGSEAEGHVWQPARSHFAPFTSVKVVTSYNFMGNPLSKTVRESAWAEQNSQWTEVASVQNVTHYAYWGQDKYFQQKAVKDPAGRITFTDYYDNEATGGKKGQVYRVYDPKHTAYNNSSGQDWKYLVEPDDPDTFAAEFDYDASGRPTDVYKLQKTTPGAWTYVHTETSYGSDGSPWWGNAAAVVEDEGQGRINRVTETLAYDSAGRAVTVEDAAGKVFETAYNADGQVESVTRTDTNPDVPIVTYSYGTSGITNGMVTGVVDELSGVEQTFQYFSSGYGIGQVSWVIEERESATYNVGYTYNAMGDRQYAVYQTPNGNTAWRYGDYVRAGSPEQGKRIFQTLNRQGWNVPQQQWQDTPEEFHYAYDTQGKLLYAAFAMTPQQGLTEYTDEDPALRRALAVYEYDPAGRITSLTYAWQTYNSGYTGTPILGQEYAYDSVTRLRTAASFYNNPDSDGDFDLIRTETYDYDDDLDYLTEVDYNDGLPNEAQTWTYDAAGNRATDSVQGSGWSYDNLNRITASPGYSYLHDILGNRTWRNFGSSGVQRYQWDALNRATSIVGEAYGARYVYRADGMRVEKVEGLTISWVPPGEEEVSGHYDENLAENLPTSRYYYDGQMMVEDDYTVEGQYEPVVTVMRYGIGARGIDFMDKRVDDGPETKGYPIYDGHGNMIATLGQTQGSPYYSLADLRSYDVWGAVRSGSTNGDPKQRYCANLGHVQDDESGLIYMRARYYEPWSGRFISEDPARDGRQWFVYCRNNPLGFADANGKNPLALFLIFLGAAGILKTVTVMAPALHLLAIGLSRARDSFEVETLWNEYMDAYRGSSLLGEEGSLIARLAGTALQILNHAAGKAGAPWGIAVSGLSIGARGAFLCYGYQLRIAWYFADIDNY